MSRLHLFPDAILKTPCSVVPDSEIAALAPLVEQMRKDVVKYHGFALAAPQAGYSKRFFVLDTASHDLQIHQVCLDGEWQELPPVLINPTIVLGDETFLFKESCLSLPDVFGYNLRAKRVAVSYQDLTGVWCQIIAEGVLAVVLQHECNHLDGKLFIDQLNNFELNRCIAKINKLRRR